jgi:hypothetical protein
MTKQRMRRGGGAPASDAVVLRGGSLDPQILREDAGTNFAVYGFYGLSVWLPDERHPEDALLATKLLKSRVVRRFTAGDLTARDLELWDTGQSPHYDVVYIRAASPDDLVEAVVAAPCTTVINPSYDPDGGPDR